MFVSLVVYGGLIEVVQSFVPNRFGSLPDFVADLAGIVLGLILYRYLTPACFKHPKDKYINESILTKP